MKKTEALLVHHRGRDAADAACESPAEVVRLAARPSDPNPSNAPVPTRNRTRARTGTARFAEPAGFGLRPAWAFTIDALVQAPFPIRPRRIGASHRQARI